MWGPKEDPKDNDICKVYFWGVPKEEIPKVIALFLDGPLKNEYRYKKLLLTIYFLRKREGKFSYRNDKYINPGNFIMKSNLTRAIIKSNRGDIP